MSRVSPTLRAEACELIARFRLLALQAKAEGNVRVERQCRVEIEMIERALRNERDPNLS